MSGRSDISDEQLRDIRNAVIEERKELTYEDTLVALFGPFGSKYTPFDLTVFDKAERQSATDGSGLRQTYAEQMLSRSANTICRRESQRLEQIRDALHGAGVNAFLAGSVPPFREADVDAGDIRTWGTHLDDETIVQEWTYIQQSYYYAQIADLIVFVFTYTGNPRGAIYELADATRGIPRDDLRSFCNRCLLFYEHDAKTERRLQDDFDDHDDIDLRHYVRDEETGPGYLSAMVEHLVYEYPPLGWHDFDERTEVVDHVVRRVRSKSFSPAVDER